MEETGSALLCRRVGFTLKLGQCNGVHLLKPWILVLCSGTCTSVGYLWFTCEAAAVGRKIILKKTTAAAKNTHKIHTNIPHISTACVCVQFLI